MWFYAKNNKRLGPFTLSQMEQLAKSGLLQPNDMVLRKVRENGLPPVPFRNSSPLSKPSAEAYYGRGDAYRGRKDYERAIADCGEALRREPKNVKCLNGRAMAYLAKREYQQAINDFTNVIQCTAGSDGLAKRDRCIAHIYRGKAYLGQKEYDRAIEDLSEAIRLDPQNGGAYYNRSIAYKAKGNSEQAETDRKETIRLGFDDRRQHEP